MARKTRSPSLVSDCLYLSRCSADLAVEWLAKRPVTRSIVTGTIDTPPESHLTEYILLRRRDPFIDLGLARYGRSRSILIRLYDRGDSNLRVVLAGNGSLFTGVELPKTGWRLPRHSYRDLAGDIVLHGALPVLRALMSNPDLESRFYQAVFETFMPNFSATASPDISSDTKVSPERFRLMMRYLAENPRISIARHKSAERYYADAQSADEYDILFTAAWNLATIVPVTFEWAEVLAALYRRLHKPFDCLADVDSIVARWRIDAPRGPDPYRMVREALCTNFVEPSLAELRSDDPARRAAFLRQFDPEDRKFSDLDWAEISALDRGWGYAVFDNAKVWTSAKARTRYQKALWDNDVRHSDLALSASVDERIDLLRLEHPEWFAKEEAAPPALATSKQIEDIRGDISQLLPALKQGANSKLLTAGVFIAGLIVGLLF